MQGNDETKFRILTSRGKGKGISKGLNFTCNVSLFKQYHGYVCDQLWYYLYFFLSFSFFGYSCSISFASSSSSTWPLNVGALQGLVQALFSCYPHIPCRRSTLTLYLSSVCLGLQNLCLQPFWPQCLIVSQTSYTQNALN